MSIRHPGVEITQQFVTASPSVTEPRLAPLIVGPCFQIVAAFDDGGNPQAAALAGAYKDGNGTVTYDLPGLVEESSIAGFEDDIRVFLVFGNGTFLELNSASEELLLVDDDTGGSYTASTRLFEDSSALFTQVGVEVGDVIRVAYRGDVVDVPVEVVLSDTQLTLKAGHLPEDLGSLTYDVVRSPAQFVVATGAQSQAKIGDNTNYIQFVVRTMKFDGTTPGDFLGSQGDQLSLVVAGSQQFASGVDGATGDCIWSSASGTYLTTVGSRGTLSGTNYCLVTGTPGDGSVLRQVVGVISDTRLVIEAGEGVSQSALDWSVGVETDTGVDGATEGTGNTFTGDAAEVFLTSIPNAAGTPTAATYIEIEGVGVYPVTAVSSDTELTITGTVSTQSLAGQNYTIVQQSESGSDGATAALTDFVSVSADFAGLPTPVTALSLVQGASESEADAVSSVTDADHLVLASASAASGNGLTFGVSATAAPLSISFDAVNNTINLQLERTAGISSSTFAEVDAAVDTDTDPAFNAVVSDILTSTIQGSTLTTLTGGDFGTYLLDGGSDASQILLDADLIGSATPTVSVYMSYKALRLDVSDRAANAELLSFEDSTSMDAAVGPISTENPLALGLFFALANAPSVRVKGIGVGEVTATKPNGTAEGYASALAFAEAQDVYFIVPMTNDPVVGQLVDAHVTAMSQPANKAERVGLINVPLPAFQSAAVLASGNLGNTGTIVGVDPAEFMTSVDLVAAGVQAGDVLVVTALGDAASSPSVVNGTVGPVYGAVVSGIKSGDNFTAELDGTVSGLAVGWNTQVDVSWTIYRAGVAINSSAERASEIQATGESYANRRLGIVWPDAVIGPVGGTDSVLEGFYAAAAIAGKKAQEPPAQGLTRSSIVGFTGVRNSNGYFSTSQLNSMAGGGIMILTQDATNGPLRVRHQLMSDTSSIERREFSITTALDAVAKILRAALDKQVGRFNITQSFLDAIATSVQGIGQFAVATAIIRSFSLSLIEQNEHAPDTIDITAVIEVLYPANYFAVTFQV